MNTKRAELVVTSGEYSVLIDRESSSAKYFGTSGEYVVCRGYDPETKSWSYALAYTTNEANAFAVFAKALGSNMIKSETERMSGISYDRMSEIATRFKDAALNDGYYCLDEIMDDLDLSEKEMEYFDIQTEEDEEDDW